MPRRLKLIFEYDGTEFYGWQSQLSSNATAPAPVRTVQDTIEAALAALIGREIRIQGASRTDEGVHAAGQVAHLDWPDDLAIEPERVARALNSHLPGDVVCRRSEAVPPEFHAQRSATGKIYRYRILAPMDRSALYRRYHWFLRYPLDAEAMRAGAKHLIGTHDCSAFVGSLDPTQNQRVEEGKPPLDTVREIRRIDLHEAALEFTPPGAREARVIEIDVEGGGFLYKMVRTIVGTLVEVGRGRYPPEWVGEVLATRDRKRAGPTAPPHGLCLMQVFYPTE
ncbi:MAG: tRNA pseudouridine synthase A [Planctomycetota bacterium]